jgi:hypothetical protein
VTAQVVSADPSKLRVSLSLKALAPDPLRETIETLSWREASGDDELLPQVVEIVSVLRMEAGISGVEVGRQAEEKAVVAQVRVRVLCACVQCVLRLLVVVVFFCRRPGSVAARFAAAHAL